MVSTSGDAESSRSRSNQRRRKKAQTPDRGERVISQAKNETWNEEERCDERQRQADERRVRPESTCKISAEESCQEKWEQG